MAIQMTSSPGVLRSIRGYAPTAAKLLIVIFGVVMFVKVISVSPNLETLLSNSDEYIITTPREHIYGLSLWPNHCQPTQTNKGLLLVRTNHHSPNLRRLLREKWRDVERICGIGIVFLIGKLNGQLEDKTQKEIMTEGMEFHDILQSSVILDQELDRQNQVIRAFGSWMVEECGRKFDSILFVNSVADDSFDMVHSNAAIIALRTGEVHGDTLRKDFHNCTTHIPALRWTSIQRNPARVCESPPLSKSKSDQLDELYARHLMNEAVGRPGHHWWRQEYNYVLTEPKFCTNFTATPPFMIIFTHSAVGNFDRRQKIRQTWASVESKRRNKVQNLFFLGSSDDVTTMELVVNESALHRDIIQENYPDTFRNLGIKQRSALKFFSAYCGHLNFSYLMKTDDDMLLDVDAIVRYMASQVDASHPEGRPLYCFSVAWRDVVSRDPKNKWYVTAEEFPGRYYPPYCHGAGYLMSRDVAAHLYSTSHDGRIFWIDDIYVTGFLARNTGNVTHLVLPNQSPYLSSGVQPAEVLRQKKWLLHGSSKTETYDGYWSAFQSRWNLTERNYFLALLKKDGENYTSVQESLFDFLP